MKRLPLLLASLLLASAALAQTATLSVVAPLVCPPGCVVAPPVPPEPPPGGTKSLGGSGDTNAATVRIGDNLYSITLTQPAGVRVVWGERPGTQPATVTGTLTCGANSWIGRGNQSGGSVGNPAAINAAGTCLFKLNSSAPNVLTITYYANRPR